MIDRLEMIRRRLVSFYDLAMGSQSEKHFFLWLYDYIRVFDQVDELGGVFGAINEQKVLEYKPINDLIPKGEAEIERTYKQVAKYVSDNKIDHKVILKELEEYRMAKDGTYSSSRGHLADLYDKVSYTLITMVEDGTVGDLKFAQKFGTVSDERRISEWTFSPSYNEYDLLSTGIKNIQETRLWYCWDKVVIAFKVIDDFKQEVVTDLLEKKKHFEAMNWAGLRTEMRGIIDEKNNPNSRVYEFISKDYRYYLAKVHQFAEEYVQSNPVPSRARSKHNNQNIEMPIEVKWKMIKDENYIVLVINGKEVRYSATDDGGILLSEVEENVGTVFNDEVYEKLSGNDKDSEDKKTVKRKAYDVARAINARILKETMVSEFLIKGFEKVGFNPVYKRI